MSRPAHSDASSEKFHIATYDLSASVRPFRPSHPELRETVAGSARNPNVQLPDPPTPPMAMELERECPNCGGERTFYRSAAMNLHLGLKTKWACPDCDYGFVQVDGIDTSEA